MTVTPRPARLFLCMTGHMLALRVVILLFSLEYIASFTNTQLRRTVGFSLDKFHSGGQISVDTTVQTKDKNTSKTGGIFGEQKMIVLLLRGLHSKGNMTKQSN